MPFFFPPLLHILELLQIHFEILWIHMRQSEATFAERSALWFSHPSLRTVKRVQYDLPQHNNVLSDRWCLLENNGKTSKEYTYMRICARFRCRCSHSSVARTRGQNVAWMSKSQGQFFFSISAFISCRRAKTKAMQRQQNPVCLERL